MPKKSFPITRRRILAGGATTLAALPFASSRLFAQSSAERVVPFLDKTPDPPQPELSELNTRSWNEISEWITPNESFFTVAHYDQPEIDGSKYELTVSGLVKNEISLKLDELKGLPRQEVNYTLECAGNRGFDWFVGGIGNARWAGTPLAPILERAGVQSDGIEVVFYGADRGEEEFARKTVQQNFARSMSIEDARDSNLLLCYEMNGKPLSRGHGYPVRLIAPGWFGIANVKWLDRIEVWPTRYAGRFMARDYVTVREESRPDGSSTVTQKVVGRSLLTSVPAKVTEKEGRFRVYGAAWGRPIASVEVRVDSGSGQKGTWQKAILDQGTEDEHAWKFWHFDFRPEGGGEVSLTSRAIDKQGRVQPSADDPLVTKKLTYWEDNGQITRKIQV